ncbi:MAG TPA: hypothetical protein DEH78_28170, partial [Solibacterales bacterium]|nr:hypothetical protein [Bryobacterales bacterium]
MTLRSLAALCCIPSLFAADLLLVNANIITADPARPSAQALLVRHGRIAAVGAAAPLRRLASPDARVLDLQGKTIIPGVNDAHLHPRPVFPETSPYFTPSLGPDSVRTMAELIDALRKKAAVTPKGRVVRGNRYQDTRLGRHPTRLDLDQASTEHPIVITHSSGHITVVNTFALRAAAITKDTPDPPGGALDRDPDGSPNGIVRESARRLLAKATAAAEDPVPYQEQVEGMLRCLRQYAARGITSVSAAGISPDSVRLFQDVVKAGSPVRLGLMLSESHFPAAAALGLTSGFGNDMLRLTSIKAFHGNSLSGRTCWLSEEYSDRPGYFGIPPARSQEEFDRAFQKMHDAGWQVATHSNGDREIDMVLTAIERAQAR